MIQLAALARWSLSTELLSGDIEYYITVIIKQSLISNNLEKRLCDKAVTSRNKPFRQELDELQVYKDSQINLYLSHLHF